MFVVYLCILFLPVVLELCVKQTVEPQWLKHLWDHGNSFETWVVRATEG